jgi:hypothetical protein
MSLLQPETGTRGGRAAISPAAIAGFGAAFPATRPQRELWDSFFAEHYGHSKKARAVWLRCGV